MLRAFRYNRSVFLLYCTSLNATKLWLWNSYEICTEHRCEEGGVLPSICQYHEITLPARDQPWGEEEFSYFGPKCFLKQKACQLSLLSRETDLTLIIIILKNKKQRCLYSTKGKEGLAANTLHKPSHARGAGKECFHLEIVRFLTHREARIRSRVRS